MPAAREGRSATVLHSSIYVFGGRVPPPFDAMMRDILAGSVVEPGLIE